MATDKRPLVLIQSRHEEDPNFGLSLERQQKLEEYFDLITLSELSQRPDCLHKVEGIGVVEPSQLPLQFYDVVSKLKNLKAISVSGVGTDAYYELFKPFGVPMANTPHAVTSATSDFAIGLMLNTGYDITYGAGIAMQQKPGRVSRNHIVYGVTGRTLGIIGMGRIGYAIARRARAFDMKILYHNRQRRPAEEENHVGASYCTSIDNMLPLCDYVIISCPLTKDTRLSFNKDKFKLMRNTATIINISRGEIIDQDALVEALASGGIRQAALDVTTPEPLPENHPLLKLPNVLITPHIGGLSIVGQHMVLEHHIENLKAALIDGKPMPYQIKG